MTGEMAAGTRTIVVTGASSGIGRELARIAVHAGWDVIATGRRAERLDLLRRETSAQTGTMHTLALDLREAGAANRIVALALERTGRVDVVANVAGTGGIGNVVDQSDDELREQFEVHAVLPVAIVREARSALRERKGLVMFVGSGVARVPMGGFGAYAAAKAAVRSLSRTVRVELRADGIDVTYVDPGVIATEFHSRLGFQRPPGYMTASAESVARKMFEAIVKRPRELNAVPWQTFATSLGQLAPALIDVILARAGNVLGTARAAPRENGAAVTPASQPSAEATPEPKAERGATPEPGPPAGPASESSTLAAALEPLANRMKRQKLTSEFVASLFVVGATFELNEVAMRWAGMPNKNERAITRDVLAALAGAGFLEEVTPGRFRVLRAAV